MENVRARRLLLLEDDAVSAAFLSQALAALPARVDHAPSLAAARALAGEGHDLWLFDAHLPDGHGADLLREWRASGLQTPALALTAEDQPQALARLREAGFIEVLAKPVAATALLAIVRARLVPAGSPPAWDDAAALAALGGRDAAVQAMRSLFLQELPGQQRQVLAACRGSDAAAAREHLHRLKASCGFVGAAALLAAVRDLSARPQDAAALREFQAQALALLEAG